MQYRIEAAQILENVIELLLQLDRLTDSYRSHRLEKLQPLTARLAQIRDDLREETGMLPAMQKTGELCSRLIGGNWGVNDKHYRSTLARILGSHQKHPKQSKASLGGLRGGRPRKDGRPTQTLERKGYSADTIPEPKSGRVRVHPTVRESLKTRDQV
jgi:hypothetical protein